MPVSNGRFQPYPPPPQTSGPSSQPPYKGGLTIYHATQKQSTSFHGGSKRGSQNIPKSYLSNDSLAESECSLRIALKAKINATTNDMSNYSQVEMSEQGSLERTFKHNKARLSEHSADGSDGSLGVRRDSKKNPIGIKKASMGNLRAQRTQCKIEFKSVMDQSMNQCMSQRNIEKSSSGQNSARTEDKRQKHKIMKNNFLGEQPKQPHSLTANNRKVVMLKSKPLPESAALQPGSMFNLMTVRPQQFEEKSPPNKAQTQHPNLTRTKPMNYIQPVHEINGDPTTKESAKNQSIYSGMNSLNSTLNATQNSLLLSKNFQSAAKHTTAIKGEHSVGAVKADHKVVGAPS